MEDDYSIKILRHELAHGKRSFVLKECVIDDINREVMLINQGMIISKDFEDGQGLASYFYEASQQHRNPKNKWDCSICSDINVLQKINEIY